MADTKMQTTKYGMLRFIIYIVICHYSHSLIRVSVYGVSLVPADPAVCVGDNITFTCFSDDTTNPARQIIPILSSESVKNGSVLNLLNNSKSEMTLSNITEDHDHVAVCCIFDDDDKNCGIYSNVISILNVYPLPVQVQNITCVVENYNRSLNCSWDYATTYEEYKKPEITLEWKNNGSPSWMECPHLDIEKGFCLWKSSQTNFAFREIQIKVILKQKCEKTAVSKYEIDASKIVKPDPVLELSSNVINSTCIEVKWRSSDMKYPKRHMVIVSCRWTEDQEIHFNTTTITEQQIQSRTLCDLHPFTTYTMVVSTLPVGNQSGYRSDPKTVNAVTYTDKPTSSPKVIQGGYHWHRRECTWNQNERRVCIFWKPLREIEKNGLIQYTIHALTENIQTNKFFEFDDKQVYGCLDNVPCDVTTNIAVTVRNINGTSEQFSTLVISSAIQELPQPIFYVEADNMNKLYFNMGKTRYGSDILVAWCHNNKGDCQVDSEVQWKKFAFDPGEIVIQLSAGDNPRDFLYGVSVVGEHGSSGLEWQECVYAKAQRPTREPTKVVVENGPIDNSLYVSWDKLYCKPGEPYIVLYNIQYSDLADGNHKSHNVSASGEARVLLEDLTEDQTYVVTVRAVTVDGLYGPESQPQSGIPLHKGFRSGTIVGLSLGAFVGVVVLVTSCYCILWTCQKKAVYKIKNAGEITVPDFDTNNVGRQVLNKLAVSRHSFVSGQSYSSYDDYVREAGLFNSDSETTNHISTNFLNNASQENSHKNVDNCTPYVVLKTSEHLHAVPCVSSTSNVASNETEDNVHCSHNVLESHDLNELHNNSINHSPNMVISNAINEMEDENIVISTAMVGTKKSVRHDNYAVHAPCSNTIKISDVNPEVYVAFTKVKVPRNERDDGYVPHTPVAVTSKTFDEVNNECVSTANDKEPNTSDEKDEGCVIHTAVVLTSESLTERSDECTYTSDHVSNNELVGSYFECVYSGASTYTLSDSNTLDYHTATVEHLQ